jgi:hypothetical protein
LGGGGRGGRAFEEDVHEAARDAREGFEVRGNEGRVDGVEGDRGEAHEFAGFFDGECGL